MALRRRLRTARPGHPRSGVRNRAAMPSKRPSPTPQRLHDLHHIPLRQQVLGVAAAGDDLAVDLDRDAAGGEALGGEEVGEGAGGGEGEGGAVESDVHGRIVGGRDGPPWPLGRQPGPLAGADLSRGRLRETMPPPSGAVFRRRRFSRVSISSFTFPGVGLCRPIVGPRGPSAIF